MALTKVTNSMIDGSVINAKDFGAIGDGVADDTAAIQAALDSADSVVFLPPGVYNCSSSLTIDSGNSIIGADVATWKLTTNSMSVLNFTADVNGITLLGADYRNSVKNLVITNNLTAGTSTKTGISFDKGAASTHGLANIIENVVVDGFQTGLDQGYAGDFNWFMEVNNLKIDACEYGIVLAGSNGASAFNSVHINAAGGSWGATTTRGIVVNSANGVVFNNLSVENCYRGIDWADDNENSRIYVYGVYFEAIGDRFINVSGAGQIYIDGARFAYPSSATPYAVNTSATAADNGQVVVVINNLQLQTTSGGQAFNRITNLNSNTARTTVNILNVMLNANLNGLFANNAPNKITFTTQDQASNVTEFIQLANSPTSLIGKTVRGDAASAPGAGTFVFDLPSGGTVSGLTTNSFVEYALNSSLIARKIWSGSAWVTQSYS